MSGWNDRYSLFQKQAAKYVQQVNMDDFGHSTYCSFHKKYFYGSSPKTGCSTIKKVLIQAELGHRVDFEHPEYIHYREFNPFLKIWQVGNLDDYFQRDDIFKFCFVRNPYTRLLSCYLDKIKNGKYQSHQPKIQFGLKPDDERVLTFPEFVDLVVEQPVMFMDQHWRTQYYQTFQANIKYDFIGRFERFTEDFHYVLKHLDIDTAEYYDTETSHATQANEQLQDYYTPELAQKVYQKFKIDFEYFGYEEELA